MNRVFLFANVLVASALAASTAIASVIYDSPSDGFGPSGKSTISGALLGDPNIAFDSFSLSPATAITGVSFDSWTLHQPLHDDRVTSVSWEILDLSKNFLTGGVASPVTQFYAVNFLDFDIDINTFTIPSLSLPGGVYYLGLYDAHSVSGRPVGWDQTTNSSSGYIPSAAQQLPNTFQIFGEPVGVPEPRSWALIIAGFGAVGAVMRRRRAVLAPVEA